MSFAVGAGKAAEVGLTDQRFLEIVEQAFLRWQLVDCGQGKPPGLFVQSAGLVTADDEFFCNAPDLNLGIWLFQSDWDYGEDAVGNTGPIFDSDTGEILDADVELNTARLKAMPAESREAVLLAIATHEAGHFLGLAHTDVRSAIMFAQYGGMDLQGRDLSADDVDGICAIYPPESTPRRCPKITVEPAALDKKSCDQAIAAHAADDEVAGDGCTIAIRSPLPSLRVSHWLTASALLALGLCRRRCH